jgi:hypothetical protein
MPPSASRHFCGRRKIFLRPGPCVVHTAGEPEIAPTPSAPAGFRRGGGGAVYYSITSVVRESSLGGTSMPIARAVGKLITKSNFMDCKTGRSSGLSPLSIRPA